MFDRISDFTLTGGSDSGDADASELSTLLDEAEELVHVLANDGRLEHTEEGRMSTVEASGDAQAYVLVTDERALFVFGDRPESPEIEITLTDFQTCHHRTGLLRSELQVVATDQSVVFDPDEGDIEAAADYLNRVGSCWSDVVSALDRARHTISEFEEHCAQGEASRETYLSAKSKLSEARQCADSADDAPTAKMRSRIDEAQEEIERRHVTAWLDRVTDRIDAVEAALDTEKWDEACETYVEARDALSLARDDLDEADGDLPAASERLTDLESSLEAVGEAFLSESDASCEQALSADDPAVAVDNWEEAFDRYSAAVEAGWNGTEPVSGEALELQLTWVTASLLEALDSHASMLESRGEDCEDDDEAVEYYDRAADWYERAGQYAADHPEYDPDEFASAAQRVEDKKLDRSGWEFGTA